MVPIDTKSSMRLLVMTDYTIDVIIIFSKHRYTQLNNDIHDRKSFHIQGGVFFDDLYGDLEN